mmetsp:Transcript_4212/g.7170  ORF Transcript_4212/g.7170 Transcript_4212/m.7170 type:complete len:109 (-) Transcript_4212:2592-2918(-)
MAGLVGVAAGNTAPVEVEMEGAEAEADFERDMVETQLAMVEQLAHIATAGDVCQVDDLLLGQEVEGKEPALTPPAEWKTHCRLPSRPAKYRLPTHWRHICGRDSTLLR